MRLWSFHPKYLDNLGLSRCYNEGLGGLKANLGLQRMHKNHPQLVRFKNSKTFIENLSYYLSVVYNYAIYDCNKSYKTNELINHWAINNIGKIPVTSGQLDFEYNWLINKMNSGRCKNSFEKVEMLNKDLIENSLELHPLFFKIYGNVEPWEKSQKTI